MYTNQDLNRAVEENIFSQESVENFRLYIAQEKSTQSVDEENFKLVSGFNDIFVVIASLLLLISSWWIASAVHPLLSPLVVALLSWGLSEFFVRKRKMSFPAIILLLTFVWSIFILFSGSLILASAMAGVSTYFHWKRFAVPITIAIGMGVVTTFIVALLVKIFPNLEAYIAFPIFLMGIGVFIVAMYWDIKDKKRVTNDSDVAFWLHLLASPLIIHSIFLGLNIFDNNIGIDAMFDILASYVLLSAISLIIDRRALMVSSLLYVLYALNTIFHTYGFQDYSLAIGGTIIGFGLLVLTAFWTDVRAILVGFLPLFIQNRVPLTIKKSKNG